MTGAEGTSGVVPADDAVVAGSAGEGRGALIDGAVTGETSGGEARGEGTLTLEPVKDIFRAHGHVEPSGAGERAPCRETRPAVDERRWRHLRPVEMLVPLIDIVLSRGPLKTFSFSSGSESLSSSQMPFLAY